MSEEAMEAMDEMTPSEASLTEDLKAAWDAVEGLDDGESDVSEPPEPTHTVEEPGDGGEIQQEGDAAGVRPEAEQKSQATPNDNATLETPPKGLPVDAREVWNGVPEAVKKAIVKREQDYERGIVQYAEKAKRADQMDQALGQYNQLFAATGASPPQLVGQLLQTTSILQMGSKSNKANVVAELIKQFDVDIKALDNVLVGAKPPPELQQQEQLQQTIQQHLAPLQQQLSHYQQQEQARYQQQMQRVNQEINQFASDPKNEFWNEVKGQVADMMSLAHKNGQVLSLKEAYDRACQWHPEISKILQNRQASQAVSQKRQASSSIYGTMGGEPGNAPANSVREAIEMAWENAGRM